MDKELPWFKFNPSKWDSGNIQICSRDDKGLFMDICALYWTRVGHLSVKLATQKLCAGNAVALNSLIESNVIKVIDGQICIDFLNEQLAEFENISSTNSKNAREGWEKRRREANPMPSHSDPNARREEEKREEKKREEETRLPFGSLEFSKAWSEWETHRKQLKKKLTPKTKEMQLRTLGAVPEQVAIDMINQSIGNGWTGLFELKNNGNGKTKSVITEIERAKQFIAARQAAKGAA